MSWKPLLLVTLTALILTYLVLVLGAYVRLTDAGLGCPDWPGCYGEWIVPAEDHAETINQAYPQRPYDQGKAWREMLHRYGAAILGLMIISLVLLAFFAYREYFSLSVAILLLFIFQGMLGMWTVTLLLKPAIVTAHLIGGMTILSLLFLLFLRQTRFVTHASVALKKLRPFALLMLIALAVQIFLGGWTSANYAALICPEFPQCRDGSWVPPTDFAEGFTFWREPGMDYEGGILDAAARTAIHLSHRFGALLVVIIATVLALRLFKTGNTMAKRLAVLMLSLLSLQVALGIANIVKVLPLGVAVAHNGVAALLLLSVIAIIYLGFGARDLQYE